MTKKTTINKIVSSKAFWIIISLLASFLLWTYIMSTEETTIEMTFSNVKVVYQGADDLRATRGLIVTGADADTVSVRLKGTRRVLGNLSSADLSAVIDVSGISQAREMQVSYSLQYPTNVDKSSITVLSKSPETISFSVVQEANKTLEVKGVFTGSVKDGYTAEPIQVDPSSITLYGPQEELDAVDSICVYVTRTDLDKSIAPTNCPYVLLDKDGNELEWLGETSSDEMVGHFYAYSNYFDLVADDEEKKLIASVVKKILDHILDNKFRLVDTDGVPTTWANWDPDLLNNDHKWIYEKGTNSLQILTFLKAGYHITGDKRYEDAFEYLIRDKHFAMNLMQYKILDGHLLHIDDNHDFLMISLLMRYVDDPKLRSVFAMGLTHHWDDEKAEHNAFFNFVYGACTGEQCDIETSIDELADYPMDQILWTLYNSWRDLDWDMRPTEVGMIPQLYHPLPAHERRINSCDSNRFIADSGIAGEAERLFTKSDDPTAFTMFPGTGDDHGMYLMACTNYTHPYWFARYYGLIEEAE